MKNCSFNSNDCESKFDADTEETVLSNQQKHFIVIYATKLFCCTNNKFYQINQILVISTKYFFGNTNKLLLHKFLSQGMLGKTVKNIKHE